MTTTSAQVVALDIRPQDGKLYNLIEENVADKYEPSIFDFGGSYYSGECVGSKKNRPTDC